MGVFALWLLGAHPLSSALAYVTPSPQFPLGAMSLENRIALLDRARRTGSFVVEDNYEGDFRYQGSPLMALAALDRAVGEGKAFRAGSKKLGVRAERPSAPTLSLVAEPFDGR